LWNQKIQRTNKYEVKWIKEINEVFTMQEQDIIKEVVKSVKAKKPKFNAIKYATIWQTTLSPLFEEVMQNE